VVGVWLFAIPPLVNNAMTSRLEADRLNHVRLFPNAVDLSDTDIAGFAALPNVVAADAKTVTNAQIAVGERIIDIGLIGVRDYADQEIDVVGIDDGRAPSSGEVMVDAENLRHGRLGADIDDTISVLREAGGTQDFTVTGTGGTLLFAAGVREGDPIVYTTADAIPAITGWSGTTSIELLLDRRDQAATEQTIAAAQDYLEALNPGQTYWNTAAAWEPGEWPGKDDFDNFRSLFTILAAVAAGSGLLMVANTMNTLVREETNEIGVMKAIGARRRHLAGTYLQTAALLGLIATIIGTVVGVLLVNLLIGSIAGSLLSAEPQFGVPFEVLGLAVAFGIGGTMLASLPAVWRAIRIPVREAIEHRGIEAAFGTGTIDRMLQRVTPRSPSVRLGLRSTARRKGRTVATGVQIGLAVGTALAFISLAATIMNVADQALEGEAGDVHLFDQGGRAFDASSQRIIGSTDGVAAAHRVHYSGVGFRGGEYSAWGLDPDTIYPHELSAGRWLNDTDVDAVVVGPAFANVHDIVVGDELRFERFDGPYDATVVGIDRVMVNDGLNVFTPLTPLLEATGRSGPNGFWIEVDTNSEAEIAAVAGSVEQAMRSRGHIVRTRLQHVERAATQAEARLILTFIVLLGVPVLAIGMIALVNTLTGNVLERTKEFGVLRAIGARRRHLAKMLRAEGLAVAFVGWLIGLPIGYALARLLVWAIGRSFDATFPVVFPLWAPAPVLALTLLVAWIVVRLPLRRTVRMAPGDALRYE
jgi:putative ABC transport system permease protein